MTDKQDPIAHAARLLREAAEELRQAHAYNNSEGWENETDAKAAYDEHLAAAQALEDWEAAVGAGGVSGPLMGIASPPTAQAEAENLRKALQFYADKEHFAIAEEGAWDTVSGEPQNYWCDEAGTAMVEDGSIAKMALAGQLINFSDEDESAPPTSAEGVEHG